MTGSVDTATTRVAVDTGAASLAAAEHLVHRIDDVLGGLLTDRDGLFLSTHVARRPIARFVAVLTWSGGPAGTQVRERLATGLGLEGRGGPEVALVADPTYLEGALGAVAEATSRAAGRLVRYPGRTAVEQRTTAGRVVTASCVDAVEGLAGSPVSADSALDLTGFARPTWRAGRCTLLVQPGRNTLVPFETRDQIPCCHDH